MLGLVLTAGSHAPRPFLARAVRAVRGRALTASLVALLLGAPLAAPSRAQTHFEAVLPDSTVAALLLDDVGSLREQLAGSSWGRVLSDPAAAPLLEALEAGIDDLAARGTDAWGTDPLALLQLIEGQLALGLLHFAVAEGDEEQPQYALALLLELGESRQAFAAGFDALLQRWVEDAGMLLTTETLRELPVSVVASPDGRKGQMHSLMAGSVLVLVLSSESVDGAEHAGRLVDALRGTGGDSLAQAPAFAASMAARDAVEHEGLRLFGSAELLRDLVQPLLVDQEPDSDRAARYDGLALDALRSISGSSWFDVEWGHAVLRLDVTRADGIWGVVAAAVDQQRCELLSLAPPDVNTAFAANLDLGGAFDAGLELIAALDAQLALELIQDMAEMEGEQGFHAKDDLLDGLDGQFLLFVSEVERSEALPSDGGDPVNFLLAAGLTDGEQTRALIDGVVRKNGMHAARTRVEFEGYDLYLIPMGPVFTLAYAVLDDLLVLSASATLVQEVLRRKADPELPSLASSQDFVTARALLPGDASIISYARAGDDIRSVLNALEELQRSGTLLVNPLKPPMRLPPELLEFLRALPLPDEDVVAAHAQGAELSVLVLDERGGALSHQVAP